MFPSTKRQTFICRWRSCGSKFTDKSSLISHISTHLDQQELDNLLDTKTATATSKDQSYAHTNSSAITTNPLSAKMKSALKPAQSASLNSIKSVASTSDSAHSSTTEHHFSSTLAQAPFSAPKKKRAKKIIDTGDDIICMICKSPDFSSNNQIVMCDKCSDWYHQLCHSPAISDHFIKNVQLQWLCKNCKV